MAFLKRIAPLILILPSLCHALPRFSGYCQQGNTTVRTSATPSSNVVQGSYPRANVTAYITGGAVGYVTTSGTTVTWVSGTQFDANSDWNGLTITINSVAYTISSVASISSLTLTSSAGTQASPVAYSITTAPAPIFSDYAGSTPKSNPATCDSTGYFFFYAANSTLDLKFSGTGITTPFTLAAVSGIDPLTIPLTVSSRSYIAAGLTFYQACASAAAQGLTLVIDQTWYGIATSGTCSATIQGGGGGLIQPASGQTVTLARNTNCPATQQCFDTSLGGTVVLSGNPSVNVEWWGAPGDGSTSDCPGFQGAVNSTDKLIYATQSIHYYAPCTLTMISGQSVQFGTGAHQFNGWIIPDSSTLKTVGNVSLLGQGSGLTTLKQVAGANQDFIRSNSFYSLFDTGNKFGTSGLTLNGLTLDGNGANQTITKLTITNVASTTPLAVTTSASHGLSSGQVVFQKNIGGMPEAEGAFVITVTGANTYTLNGTTSFPPDAYTSGGVATASHGSVIANYGQNCIWDDLIIQNAAIDGVVSGWDIEPTGGYITPLDRTACHMSKIQSTSNGFDGIRWHGPHDSVMTDSAYWNNGSWGFAVDSIGSVATGSMHFHTLGSFGNIDGAVWANSPLVGADMAATGVSGDGLTNNPYGAYLTPNSGSTIVAFQIGAGVIPLEVNGDNNLIIGSVGGACSPSCIRVDSGYGNMISVNGNGISSGYVYSIHGESANNVFIANAVPIGSTGGLYDPANPPGSTDIVDLSSNTSIYSELKQDRRQQILNPVTTTVGTVSTAVSSPTITGVGTQFTTNWIGGTFTDASTHSCTIKSVASLTSMACQGNFGTLNSGVAYTVTNLPPIVSASNGIVQNIVTSPNIAFANGATTINSAGTVSDHVLSGTTDTITLPAGYTHTNSSSWEVLCTLKVQYMGTGVLPICIPISGTQFTMTGTQGANYSYWTFGN